MIKGYGIAHFPDEKVTADTLFFTGSTTKAFTAAIVAQLVHDDSYPDLSWDSPIADFLREDFVLPDEHATLHTTIEDALSHRTGMPRHEASYGRGTDETPQSIVRRLRYLPFTYAPRTQYQYNNQMYATMTHVIQTVTGVEQGKLTTEKIWKPLGMSSTTYDPAVLSDPKNSVARGYYYAPNETYIAEPYMNLLPLAGAGALISNVKDYSLWIKALLDAANPDTVANKSSPITHEIWNDVTKPRTIAFESPDEIKLNPSLYALGWGTGFFQGKSIVSHNGGLIGFGTELSLLPEFGFGVVTMGNTASTSNKAGKKIVTRVMAKKLGLPADAEASLHSMLAQSFDMNPSRGKDLAMSHEEYHPTRLPLPGSTENFAGNYNHPGYGSINLKALSSGSLQGFFASHTWPSRLDFNHLTDTTFTVNISRPHGMGDLESTSAELGVVWSVEHRGQASFRFGLDGEKVERLGIQLEPSMIEATKGDPKKWQESMIWFDKV